MFGNWLFLYQIMTAKSAHLRCSPVILHLPCARPSTSSSPWQAEARESNKKKHREEEMSSQPCKTHERLSQRWNWNGIFAAWFWTILMDFSDVKMMGKLDLFPSQARCSSCNAPTGALSGDPWWSLGKTQSRNRRFFMGTSWLIKQVNAVDILHTCRAYTTAIKGRRSCHDSNSGCCLAEEPFWATPTSSIFVRQHFQVSFSWV